MASAGVGEELKCSVCVSLHKDPVTLKCGHSFCRVCIDQVLNTQEGSEVYSCPECTGNVMNRKCPIHKKILEYYCNEDAACICVSCSLAGEHQGHQVEVLDEASEKKKEKLRNVLQKLITKREKTEERVQSLENRSKKAQEKGSGEDERVTSLFIDLRRRLDDLEKKIQSEISRQEEQLSVSRSDVIQKLEIQKEELSRKIRDIEELCNMTDPLTVLQDPDIGDLCDPEEKAEDKDTGGHDGGDENTGGHDGGDENTGGHDGGDENTGGNDGGDENTGGNDGGDENTGGNDGGDENTGGHDGGDENTGGHDGGDEDTGGHDGGVPDTEGHDGGDKVTGGHDGGDEDTGGHDGSDENTGGHDGGDEDTGGHDGGDQGLEQISNISHTLSDIIKGINVTFYVQDPADILLDVNTAHNNVLISDDQKTVSWTDTEQNRPNTAKRFQDDPQVMSIGGFSSGRHYWDVEISEAMWRVGMCYPSIDRKGRQSYIGNNIKSWVLSGGLFDSNQGAVVIHDSQVTLLPHQISSNRVRIYLDYEAGQLSFYELCDPIRHIHTFQASFTEPLHAALCVYNGSIKISEGEQQL